MVVTLFHVAVAVVAGVTGKHVGLLSREFGWRHARLHTSRYVSCAPEVSFGTAGYEAYRQEAANRTFGKQD